MSSKYRRVAIAFSSRTFRSAPSNRYSRARVTSLDQRFWAELPALKTELGLSTHRIAECLGFLPVPGPLLPDWLSARHLIAAAGNPTLSKEARERIYTLLRADTDRASRLFLAGPVAAPARVGPAPAPPPPTPPRPRP